MRVLDRINKRNGANIGEGNSSIDKPDAIASQPVQDSITSATQQEFAKADTMNKINPDKVELKGVDWRTMDYDKASKVNPNMSRSQYISEVAKYRQEKNLDPMSYDEVFQALGGKNPYITPEEEKKREKRMKAATYVDAIGGVLANLVNYVRTTNGNPSMNLSSLGRNEQRINAIRDYYSNLDKSKYSSYLDMFNKQWAEQEARNAEERKFKYQLALEENKRKSPLYQRQLETEEEKRKTEAARRENLLSSTSYNNAKAEGQRLTNEGLPAKQAAELKLIEARTEAAKRSNKGKSKKTYPNVSLTGKSGKSDIYDLNKDSDVVKFYNLLEETRGLDETQRPKNVDDMRDYIISTMYKEYEVENGAEYAKPGTGPTLGRGKQNEEETDNETDW